MIAPITIVRTEEGDWVAIYRDGKLLDQAHSFQEETLLRMLGFPCKTIWNANAEATGNQFPENLKDVVQ